MAAHLMHFHSSSKLSNCFLNGLVAFHGSNDALINNLIDHSLSRSFFSVYDLLVDVAGLEQIPILFEIHIVFRQYLL